MLSIFFFFWLNKIETHFSNRKTMNWKNMLTYHHHYNPRMSCRNMRRNLYINATRESTWYPVLRKRTKKKDNDEFVADLQWSLLQPYSLHNPIEVLNGWNDILVQNLIAIKCVIFPLIFEW